MSFYCNTKAKRFKMSNKSSPSSSRVARRWASKNRQGSKEVSADLRSEMTDFLKQVSGYNFFHELFSTTEELDREKYANEIELISQFTDDVRKIKNLPQVKEMIASVIETEDTGVPFAKAGVYAKQIAKIVDGLADKYHAKFRPEVLSEVMQGPKMYTFTPTQIQEFREEVDLAADRVAKGKLGIPIFLGMFGVPVHSYQRRASVVSTDRENLIRLASSLPAGSEKRKAILAGISKFLLK